MCSRLLPHSSSGEAFSRCNDPGKLWGLHSKRGKEPSDQLNSAGGVRFSFQKGAVVIFYAQRKLFCRAAQGIDAANKNPSPAGDSISQNGDFGKVLQPGKDAAMVAIGGFVAYSGLILFLA